MLLAASCVEGLANLYLATKTTPEQFAVLERATPIEKWVVLPGLFLKDYTFPKDGELYHDLKGVIDRRNSLMHLKEEVTRGGEVIHEGKLPKKAGDEHAFIGRCATLPVRLVQHVTRFDLSSNVEHLGLTLSFAWEFSKMWFGAEKGDATSES